MNASRGAAVESCVVARREEVTYLSSLPSLARIYLPLDKQSEEGGRECDSSSSLLASQRKQDGMSGGWTG